MSFLSPPSVPNAGDVANQQTQYNTAAAQAQQKGNMISQQTPYGALTYTSDPNSPSGYAANVSLSPEQQQLLNTRQGTQQTLGTAGNQLAGSSAGMYSRPYDLNAATGQTAGLLNDWSERYVSPIFKQQQSNKDAELYNQGLSPGSAAWDNAQNLLARNQGDVRNQYLQQNEGQAFNQTLQNYQLPLQTTAALMTGSAPQSPAFQQTPTAQIQPANYTGAVQNQFNAQQQQYNNMIGGIGQIGGIVGGSLLGSGLTGMFGGSPVGNGISGSAGGWNSANPFGGGSAGAIY